MSQTTGPLKTLLQEPNNINFNIGAHVDDSCSYSKLCCPYNGPHSHITGQTVAANRIILHPKYNVRLDWDFCLVQTDRMRLDGKNVDAVRLTGYGLLKKFT